jgi:hypothetical protein
MIIIIIIDVYILVRKKEKKVEMSFKEVVAVFF